MYSSYSNLYQQCAPKATSKLSNTKFLTPTVVPLRTYPPVKPIFEKDLTVTIHPEPSCDQSPDKKACKDWKKDPKLWGPHLWYYLHFSAANYPENPSSEQISSMKDWLCNLHVTIPCTNCSQHYQAYIENNKPYLKDICSNKTKLFNFLVDIHNKVNKRNGKPELSYDQARAIYK